MFDFKKCTFSQKARFQMYFNCFLTVLVCSAIKQVLQHKCDHWASVDTESVTKDLPWASKLQAMLKFTPASSLDYKDINL